MRARCVRDGREFGFRVRLVACLRAFKAQLKVGQLRLDAATGFQSGSRLRSDTRNTPLMCSAGFTDLHGPASSCCTYGGIEPKK